MNASFIVQISLVVIAVVTIITFIQPAFQDIADIQDETFVVSDALEKAEMLNSELRSLVAKEQQLSRVDIEALETYLPESVDVLNVMYDIESIAEVSNVSLQTITAGDSGGGSSATVSDLSDFSDIEGVDSIPSGTTLTFSVAGPYTDLKTFLQNMSTNAYPLIVETITVGNIEADGVANEQVETVGNEVAFTFDILIPSYSSDDADDS